LLRYAVLQGLIVQFILDAIHFLLDLLRHPGEFIQNAGQWATIAMMAIIFIETGLLFPLLPGDSLLIVAGIYSAQGMFNLPILIAALLPMAILGDAVSYYIGKQLGPRLFSRPKSRIFNPDHVKAAQEFYEKHGGKAIIIARFVPIVRTYVPVVAGVAQMPYKTFGWYNIIGGVAWVVSMTCSGYFMGEAARAAGFPLEEHIEKVIILVVGLSILPGIWEWWKSRKAKKNTTSSTDQT
jgi:membrane-associated protein